MQEEEQPLKFEESKKEYFQTEKGKIATKKYRDSDKGLATQDKYYSTPKFKQALRKYYYSQKGQEAYQRRKAKLDLVKSAEKWLKLNPGKGIDDYLSSLKEEQTSEDRLE